jgi:PAS domain S-box-containing protein
MSAEKQKTILLVEDEAITALTEKMTLEKYGYKVITARTGEEAVATVEKTPAIDLILMDINLGTGIDGTEAAEMILKNHDLPVVFLSSHTEPEIVAKTEKITSYGYVVKDSSGTVLDASIKMAFKLFEAKKQEKEKESRMEVALEELRKSEERFRYVLENVQDAVWSADLAGQFEFLSPVMAHIYGRPLAEMLANPAFWIEAAHPEDHARVRASNEALLRDGHVELEYRIVLPDGTVRWIFDRKILLPNKHGKFSRMAGIISDVTERKQVEEELIKNNKYIKSILDNMPIGFAVNTIDDGVARYLNDNFTKIYGWPKEVLTDVSQFFEKVYPGAEGQELKARVINDMGSGDPERMVWDDLKITTGSGEHRYISARNIPILEQNLMVSTVWDTTQMHESLKSLRKSEEKFRSIAEQSSSLIALTDANGFITYASSVSKSLFHFAPEEMCGRHFMEFLDEPAVPKATAAFRDALERGARTKNLELMMKRKDGSIFVGELNGSSFRCGGQDETLVIIRDISERKQAESQKEAALAALKESEYLLKEAQKVAHIGHWELDPKIGRPTWSEEIFHIFGLDPKKDEPSFVNHESHLHPDDWPILNMAVTKTSADGSPFDIQFRIVQPGGEIRWMHALGTATMAANGVVSKLFGTAQDITERKRWEMENQDAQEYAENIVETVREPLVVLDSDLKILKANHGFYETFKLTPGETIGNFIYDLGNRQWDIPKLRMLFEDILPTQTVFNGYEVEHDFPEVGRKIILLNARQIYRENIGSKIILLATEDITERRRLEMENQDAQEYAENIVETVREPLVVLNSALKILTANHSFYDTFKVTPGETIGNFIYDLGNRQWDIPKLRVLFEDILPNNSVFNGYEVEHDFPDIGRKTILLNARQIFRKKIGSNIILLAMEDITKRKKIEAGLEKTRKELAVIKKIADEASEFAENVIDTVREPLISLNQDLRVITVSRSFYDFFKVKPEATVGKLIYDLGNKQWDIPKLRELLETILPQKTSFNNYEVEHEFSTIGKRVMLLNARQIKRTSKKNERIILLAIEDITEHKLAEDEVKRQLAEKEILLKEVHHRIKNNIASIGGLLSLHMQSITNPEAIAVLQDAIGRVNSMGILYDKLLLSEDYKDISVKNYAESLADVVVALFPGSAKIKLEKRIADFRLDPKRLFPLGIIINELLTNIMKYAFSKRKTGLIKISLTNVDKHVKLVIQDNGNGLPVGFNINESKGFGLMLVKMLSQQLAGSFTIENHKGTRCIVEFDI